jgi:hypothetical protein
VLGAILYRAAVKNNESSQDLVLGSIRQLHLLSLLNRLLADYPLPERQGKFRN